MPVPAPELDRDRPKLKVAITGASGLVGSSLAAFLSSGGHEVRRIPRGTVERTRLEGLDAVVHLAGAGIADRRWTAARKKEILESRVLGTTRLAEAIASLEAKPKVFLSASGVGYYGSRGGELIDETAPSGSGFLAEVCRAWEAATEPATRAGIRTVRMRLGVILTPKGGALRKMLLPFRLGLGGPIGSGRQGFSWIALDDVLYAIHHLIRRDEISGAVNVVAPNPVPQREFAKALGRALHRPAFVPLPAFAVRALFGQLGEEALLAGQFVAPEALERAGFFWTSPQLDSGTFRL